MQFAEDNDVSKYRTSHWTEQWPIPSTELDRQKAGFADFNVSSLIPFGYPRAFEHVDHAYSHAFTRRHIYAGWVAVLVYLAGIYFGQQWMQARKAYELRGLLKLWNLGLFVFSLVGACRVVPQVVYGHLVNPSAYIVCRQSTLNNADPAVFFWMMLFIYSKFFELVDTAFLVLRKRPVNFLHYFHHSTVLLYCWYSWANQTSSGIYFVCMNYVVHSVMYFYYFLAALGRPPKWGMLVTVLQIAQMFAGIAVNLFHFVSFRRYANCDLATNNLYAALVMYTAYMALFVNFFLQRYCNSRSTKNSRLVSETNGHVHANGKQLKSE